MRSILSRKLFSLSAACACSNTVSELNEFGPNWASDLELEMQNECQKYGTLVHVHVDAASDGDVYLKYTEAVGGKRAFDSLNGRTFNHRVLRASYIVEAIYNSMFPAAAKL